MRKAIIYLGFFIFFIIISNYGIDYSVSKQLEKQSPYYLAFASIGVNSLEFHLDCWAKIKTTSSAEDLESYWKIIMAMLKLPAEQNLVTYEKTNNSLILSYIISHEGVNYHFILESDEIVKETYFIINVVSNEEALIKNLAAKLNNIISLKWTYYYHYTGSLDMVVGEKGCQELLKVMVKNLQIEEVDSYSHNKTFCKSGYSQLISTPSIKVNKQDINVQLAIQIDEVKQQTNIILGSPLIWGDY